jgi:hypothetical protein
VVELEGAITIGAVAAILCKYQHVSIVLLSERVVCPVWVVTVHSALLSALLSVACADFIFTTNFTRSY